MKRKLRAKLNRIGVQFRIQGCLYNLFAAVIAFLVLLSIPFAIPYAVEFFSNAFSSSAPAWEPRTTFSSVAENAFWIILALIPGISLVIGYAVSGWFAVPRIRRSSPKYEREPPLPDVHPVILSRLMNGRFLPDDVIVAILNLATRGVVHIPHRGSARSGDHSEYHDVFLELTNKGEDELDNEIDLVTFRFLKEAIFKRAQGAWLSDIVVYSRANPKEYFEWASELFYVARDQARHTGLFSSTNVRESLRRVQKLKQTTTDEEEKKDQAYNDAWKDHFYRTLWTVLVPAFGYVALNYYAIFNFWSDNEFLTVMVFVLSLPFFIVLPLFFDSFRTKQGRVELWAFRDFGRWFKHFTRIHESPLSDVTVWDRYYVYAYILDITDDGIEAAEEVGNTVMREAATIFIHTKGHTPISGSSGATHALAMRHHFKKLQGEDAYIEPKWRTRH